MMRWPLVLLLAAATACGEPPADLDIDTGTGTGGDEDDDDDPATPSNDPLDAANLLEVVRTLSTGVMEDRSPGTLGDRTAADLVTATFEQLKLWTGRQAFTDSVGRMTENVIGILASTGESPDVIVVGAHRDHLPADGGTVYPGANDNASGTAGMLAIARTLAALPPLKRTVVFVSFGSAEDPLIEGATRFVSDPGEQLAMANVVFMLDLDMIGSYNAEEIVYALGSATSLTGRTILDTELDGFPLDIELDDYAVESDHEAFCAADIPYTALWTPDPECYHEPCDTADRIDGDAMSYIATLGALLVADLAISEVDLAAERARDGCTE